MGANLLIVVATVTLQSPQQDTTVHSSQADTPQPAHGFGFERPSDVLQYNRVQGLSLGLGYHLDLPGIRGTHLYGTLRYGISDERVTGRLTVLHDARSGRISLSGYHDMVDLDPFSPGRTFSNTFNSLFAGHDNGDYALVGGASARFEAPVGSRLGLIVAVRVERQNSVRQVAKSEVNDFLGGSGLFPPNPPVDEGTFGGASIRLGRVGHTRWSLTADALGGAGHVTGRLFGDLRWRVGSRPGLTLRVKAGAATEPTPPQSLFRLGGVNTVRGFEYGTRRAPAAWAAQLDVAPFEWRIRPVAFVDAGQAASISGLLSSPALVGGGVGLSVLRGLVRFDVSRPITPDQGGKVRFDLVIGGIR